MSLGDLLDMTRHSVRARFTGRDSFLQQVYMPRYHHRHRSRKRPRHTGFACIFRALEQLEKSQFVIVETGTTRRTRGYSSNGNATLVFDRFVQFYGGRVYSVDINPEATRLCRSLVSDRVQVVTADSLEFLQGLDEPLIDLLYLDSMDLNPDDPMPSSEHHLRELKAAMPMLAPGSIIAVDDCIPAPGKGFGVRGFIEQSGYAELLHEGYQEVWRVR